MDILNRSSFNIKISIIIPCYNVAKYIEKCLKSIIKQSLNEIEIICVNDGSTDDTLKILEKYSKIDSRIKVINSSHKKQGYSRNLALNESKGEYVLFVDADDWIENESLKLLYKKAKKDNLDMLFFNLLNYEDRSGKFIESKLYNHECFTNLDKKIFNISSTADVLFEIPVCPVSKLYKKEFLTDNNFKFLEDIYYEDNEFFYKTYLNCCRAGYINKHLYIRRLHDESFTHKFTRNNFDIVLAFNAVIDYFFTNPNFDKYATDLINHVFNQIKYSLDNISLQLSDEFFNYIRNNFYAFNKYEKYFKNSLNEKNYKIYELMCDNTFYLDYLSEYKLLTVKYSIFDGKNEFIKDSSEYEKYRYNELSKNYLFSIIIPIYNTSKIIHRTLMSIINQNLNLKDIEIILVNDNSDNETYNILKKYVLKYDTFKLININHSTGSSGTPRNIGILESNSDYLMFLDHDDFYEIGALDCLYKYIKDNDLDLVFGTYNEIINENIIEKNYCHKFPECMNSLDEYPNLIVTPPPSLWTKIFKKSIIMENNILFPTILGEDAIFLSKYLINANNVAYIDEVITFHDLNENSYTNNVSYTYLIEGLISEMYLYNYFKLVNKGNLYNIRTPYLMDFYLMQFLNSFLNETEFSEIYSLFKDYIEFNNKLNLKPTSNIGNWVYNILLNDSKDSLIEFKKFYNNSKLINQNLNNNVDIGKLYDKIDDLNNENKKLIKKYNNKNNEFNYFKSEIFDSNSWKITKPLRDIVKYKKKILKKICG